ncbi:hypothetical protein [Pseudoxanthomonas wuyuanensis]
MRWCLWSLLLVVSGAGWASELIGRTVPPYPDGLQDIGGSCLSDSSDYERVCDYSIGLLAGTVAAEAEMEVGAEAEPVPRYIVAARLAGRDGQQALWEITDAQPYPKVGERFHLQTGSCRADGNDDGKLAAVVRQDPTHEFLTDVAWARRLDLASGKFVPVTGKVDCINEAYFGL